jgi:uncharacterized protein YkwD
MAAAVLALAACSGGGGSSPVPTQTKPSASPAASATPVTYTASGAVYDLPDSGTSAQPGYSVLPGGVAAAPGAAIAGADVYVGSALVLGAVAPTTVPTFVSHATTAADGSFAIPGLAAGLYALTIFAPAPHVVVLHRDLVVGPGATPGAFLMATLTPSEMGWYGQETVDRGNYGASPLVLDEAALEAARYWADFMAANSYFAHCIPAKMCETGSTAQTPAVYGPQDVDPAHRFAYFHGFNGAGEGENIAAGYGSWSAADAAFMAESANCPSGQPTNCTFSDSTGHFLNIVNTQYVWSAVALATASNGTPYFDQEFTGVSSTLASANAFRTIHPELSGRMR